MAPPGVCAGRPRRPLCVRSTLALSGDGHVMCRSGLDDGSCPLRLPAQGHPAPIELLRERMDVMLREHSQQCGGQACCRLPLPVPGKPKVELEVLTCWSRLAA